MHDHNLSHDMYDFHHRTLNCSSLCKPTGSIAYIDASGCVLAYTMLLLLFLVSGAYLIGLSRPQVIHQVPCDYTTSSCRCNQAADACEFNLQVFYLQTFTKYSLKADGSINPVDGYVHYINESGRLSSYDGNVYGAGYTEAATVDGKTYRPFIAINGRIPGPTLIVRENQTVVVNVTNNIRGQSITIHWHGQLQRNTPWMDGVGFISQCPIATGGSFRYIFKAEPSGTFFYHGHIDGQRGDGLQGALIVLEKEPETTYSDIPEQHTINLLDWWPLPFIDVFTLQRSAQEVYYPSSVGDLPTPDRDKYTASMLADGTDHGIIPYYSGLINGQGRHRDIPYSKTRLSTFRVDYGQSYRFRLVGAQMLYAYKISVDKHKLSVISTDGFFVQPVHAVDYVIVYPGERYDFVLNANQDPMQYYWIRAETLEVNTTGELPYSSLGNVVEAVLYYSNRTEPQSTDYASIRSTRPSCTSSAPCVAVNCPFRSFHPSYNTTCINVDSLRLLKPTSPSELPSNDPTDGQEYFLNFGYSGALELPDNINGRIFELPQKPLQIETQRSTLNLTKILCPSQPYTCGDGCECLHMLSIPYNSTVRFVLANFGTESHSIHMHGHSFFVVAVGYGSYDDTNNFVNGTNLSLSCSADETDAPEFSDQLCTTMHWRTGLTPSLKVTTSTLRKDTVVIPGGGYAVIQIVSASPGFWFIHCHLEPHHMSGMAMVLNIAEELQNPAPSGMTTCGDFTWSLADFYQKLDFDPTKSSQPLTTTSSLYCACITTTAQLGLTIAFSILGFVTLILVPWVSCIVACFRLRSKQKTYQALVNYDASYNLYVNDDEQQVVKKTDHTEK